MTQVFNYDKLPKVEIRPKQWVRVKTGLYEGNLAQVIHVEDPINKILIRVVPRLLDNEEKIKNIGEYNKKLKKNVKPRQKLFNPKNYEPKDLDFNKIHPILREKVITWNKMSFKDGFLIKSVKNKSLITENVVPKIDELRIFDYMKLNNEENENNENNLDNLINSMQEVDIQKKKTFSKGDKIKIIKSGFMNVPGRIVSHQNGLVEVVVDVEGINDTLELPEHYVVKNFLPGDLVKIVHGPHIGKYGLIVKVEDDTAIIFSEATMSEFKASCHDIISSTHTNYESESNAYFALGDLVKINGTNSICYILDVTKHSLKLIDTRSEIKNVSVKDVTPLTQNKPNGIDSKRNPITKFDNVKITSGPYKGKKGVIKNIFKNFVFLHNNDFVSTNGIFVDKTENIEIMEASFSTNQMTCKGLKSISRKSQKS